MRARRNRVRERLSTMRSAADIDARLATSRRHATTRRGLPNEKGPPPSRIALVSPRPKLQTRCRLHEPVPRAMALPCVVARPHPRGPGATNEPRTPSLLRGTCDLPLMRPSPSASAVALARAARAFTRAESRPSPLAALPCQRALRSRARGGTRRSRVPPSQTGQRDAPLPSNNGEGV